MAMKRMNQVLAVEKSIKSKREDQQTKLFQNIQKADLVAGLSRTYQPHQEDGEKLPPEQKKVQIKTGEVLEDFRELHAEIINITAKKDWTNQKAVADIEVDGKVIAKDVPATHLLFLEKRLGTMVDFVKKLPTLSQDTNWSFDKALGFWKSEPTQTIKTRKDESFVVVVQPTKEHPAQTAKVVKDTPVGTWTTVNFSGAMPADDVKKLLARLEKLQSAVKTAREEANQTPVVDAAPGEAILSYLFAQS